MRSLIAALFFVSAVCAAQENPAARADTVADPPLVFAQDTEPPPDFVPVQKQPVPVNNPAPHYPELARRAGIEGMVWVKIWVDAQGKSRKAVVIKSDQEILNQPSVDAAMKWTFQPAILNGKPVDVWVSVPFKFKLNKDSTGTKEKMKDGTVKPGKNRKQSAPEKKSKTQ